MKAFVVNLDSRPDRLETFKKNVFPFEVERFPGVVAATGEDGCTRSTITILQRQLAKREFPFIVFEDDCKMLVPWSEVEKAMKQLPDDWDALWLGTNPRKPLQRHSDNLFRLKGGYTSHAIIYNSKRMVEYILKNHNTPSGKNLDIFYYHVVQKYFNCFVVYPLMATQISDYSDIAKVHTNNESEISINYNRFTT
jgi:GR25 family glycosyltransferase involved in LPS biosynthesis